MEAPHSARNEDADLKVVDPCASVFVRQHTPRPFQNKPGTFLLLALERALAKKKIWAVRGAHDAQARLYDNTRWPAEEVPPVCPIHRIRRRIEAPEHLFQTRPPAGVIGKLLVVIELHHIRLVGREISALHPAGGRVWHHDVFQRATVRQFSLLYAHDLASRCIITRVRSSNSPLT